MVFFINGHHVYPSTLKNRWPCLLWLPYIWSPCIAHYPKKQVTMLTLVTIQVVNIPHRLKTDDHAYFGYQGSGLCCLHIFFLYSVTMYSPLHMGFECDPSSVRHLRRERSWTRTSKSKMSWISKEDLLTLLLLFRGASNSIPHVNQGAGFYFVFFKGKLLRNMGFECDSFQSKLSGS